MTEAGTDSEAFQAEAISYYDYKLRRVYFWPERSGEVSVEKVTF